MPRRSANTTAPVVAGTLDPEASPLVPGFVLLASPEQPHRVGELARIPVVTTPPRRRLNRSGDVYRIAVA
jgi:hypothetical protein